MASSADPINHDGLSTVATMGSKAVKYGLIGGVGAALVGGLLAGGALLLAGGIAASLAGFGFAAGVGALLGGTGAVATGIVAAIGAIASGVSYGGISAVVGGGIGALKGADQVSRESSAFRTRVTEKMQGHENKMAKTFNDGEVKGLDEGYALAVKDMTPRLEAAKQEGREEVVQAIQMQMMQAQQAEQMQMAHGAEHGKKHADKFAAHASCECKAEAVIKERQDKAANPQQLV